MSSIWTFAATALVIGAAIIYQKPIANILSSIAQKAEQTPTATTPTSSSPQQ
jgi:hypothetical protein